MLTTCVPSLLGRKPLVGERDWWTEWPLARGTRLPGVGRVEASGQLRGPTIGGEIAILRALLLRLWWGWLCSGLCPRPRGAE